MAADEMQPASEVIIEDTNSFVRAWASLSNEKRVSVFAKLKTHYILDPGGHWIRTTTTDDFHLHRVRYQLSRVLWTLERGCLAADGVILRIICGNKLCVRPSHLVPITKCSVGGSWLDGITEGDWKYAEFLIEQSSRHEDGHRIWLGAVDLIYGSCTFRQQHLFVHRLALMASQRAAIPDGMVVRHKCRFPLCSEPTHLEIGTYADNAADRKRDGTDVRGEQHPRATITSELAEQIRISVGSGSLAARGEQFGVSKSMVSHIDRGESWRPSGSALPVVRKRKIVVSELTSDDVDFDAILERLKKNSRLQPVDADDTIADRSDHWIWQKQIKPSGYGATSILSHPVDAHRAALGAYRKQFLNRTELARHQ